MSQVRQEIERKVVRHLIQRLRTESVTGNVGSKHC